MTAKITNTYKQDFPASRFIGKRYSDTDRDNGTFGAKWGEWFSKNMFAPLDGANPLVENDMGYMGAMRINNGCFEYWIGMFFPENAEVPDGYEFVDIKPLSYAVFWLYGNEQNGEIYGMDNHNMCVEEMKKQGFKRKEDDWCFERYNCPRYTTPDEKGNVILDYGIAIENV